MSNLKKILYRYSNTKCYKFAVMIRNKFRNLKKNHKTNKIKKLSKEQFYRIRPSTFMIETVLGCNLKCPECAIGADLITRKKGSMSFDDYKIIADKIKPFAKDVFLTIWGEPLMNKDIFKIIKYTATFAKTSLSTNGNLMTIGDVEKIIHSGLTSIIVSIDGTTQEVYERYRVKGSLDKALNALRMLAEAKKRFNSDIAIIPQFIVFDHNSHQMVEFNNMCREIGLRASFKPPYLRENSEFKLSNIPKYSRACYSSESERINAMSYCEASFKDIFVLLDGTVVPCCCTSNYEFKCGNLLKSEIDTIWSSKNYCDFRWALIHNNAPDYCKENCLVYLLEEKKK